MNKKFGVKHKPLSIKEKLADLLGKHFPNLIFEASDIKRCFDSAKSGGYCKWRAHGKEYTSFLRYKLNVFYGHDTMRDCIKYGIEIKDNFVNSK